MPASSMEDPIKGSEKEKNSTKQDPEGFQVHVNLPTGEIANFQAKRSSIVRDVKMTVEVNSGVPSDLFTLVYIQGENNTIELKDEQMMADIDTDVEDSMTFELSIPPWWQRFVDRCMKRDNRQILKRIAIKMNQITMEERAFVAAFIAAQKGDSQLFQSLLNGEVKIDIEQAVECSGRTLLHAAMIGGNFSCAAAIFMNGGSSLLSRADRSGVTPVDIVTSGNQPELVDQLAKYVEIKVRESTENDDAEDKSPECPNINQEDGETEEVDMTVTAKSTDDDEFLPNETAENLTFNDTSKQTRPDQTASEVEQSREDKKDLNERLLTRVSSEKVKSSRSQLKLHMPLRPSKSLHTTDRPLSARSKLITVEEIRPLSGKAAAETKQSDERLPRVNTPTSSPMSSPRMGRKLVPSLLNPDRPGSPLLRPRSPTHPACPKSPTPRPKSPLVLRPGSASGSPVFRRRVLRYPNASEPQRMRTTSFQQGGDIEPQKPRANTFHGRGNGETRTRKMSTEMKNFLMSHYPATRENRPWNAWKTVRKTQMDLIDVSDDDDDSSSEDEGEKLSTYLQSTRSRRRKTFDMWLTDKEAQQVREQTELAERAKQEELVRRKQACWRQLTGKTHGQWLEEKTGEIKAEEAAKVRAAEQSEAQRAIKRYQEWVRRKDEEAIAREERWRREAIEKLTEVKMKNQNEARKAAASKKYEEWLRSKDEEALAREDQMRKKAAEKFSETKQKRDDKMKTAWFTKKLFNV